MFCVILLVQGVWEIKILASGLSEKNVTQLTYFETKILQPNEGIGRSVKFLKDFSHWV